jgi:glycosyltransferase 2 family protein
MNEPPMQAFSRYLFPALAAVFAVVCLYGLRADIATISLAPLAHAWDLVVLAVACSLLNYVLRIVRWQRYLGRLGRSMPFGFVGLTYLAGFAFTVSPGKVGEMARARYYSRFDVSLPDVAGAFFVERLMDVIAMTALAALITTALPRYQFVMWSAGVLIVVALITLRLLPWGRIASVLEARTHLPRAVVRFGVGVAKALTAARSLLSTGPLLLGFVLGLVAWGFEGVGLFALSSMFPAVHLAPTAAVGIYAVAVLVGALSFLPGGLGSTEAVMTALLATRGYAVGDALLITMACRIVTLWFAVLIGWIAVLLLRNRMTPAVTSWP